MRRCESQTRDTVELRDRAEQRAEIAIDGENVVVAIFRKIDGDAVSGIENRIEMADVARSHYEVDPRSPLEDPLPFLLRHASADADFQLAVFFEFQLAQPPELRQHL